LERISSFIVVLQMHKIIDVVTEDVGERILMILFSFWGGVEPSPLLLRPWPIVPAQDDDGSVECLAGETEVLGGSLPHCQFVHHKSQMT
jgi:hypothetical protein